MFYSALILLKMNVNFTFTSINKTVQREVNPMKKIYHYVTSILKNELFDQKLKTECFKYKGKEIDCVESFLNFNMKNEEEIVVEGKFLGKRKEKFVENKEKLQENIKGEVEKIILPSGLTQGTVKFSDGAVYEGQVKDGKAYGKGTKRWPNDEEIYEGDFFDNKMHGVGTYKWSNGQIYQGEFRNGQRCGEGTMRWTNGEVYSGHWKNDKSEGYGKLRWPDGETYEGEWKDDKRNGHGVRKYKNGQIYDGNWKDNNMHGDGVMILPGGLRVKGKWEDGNLIKK